MAQVERIVNAHHQSLAYLNAKAQKMDATFEKGPWKEELDRVVEDSTRPREWIQARDEKVRSLVRLGTGEAP